MSNIEVLDEVVACPYCGDEKRNKQVCCGEVHFETMFVVSVNGIEQSALWTQAEIDDHCENGDIGDAIRLKRLDDDFILQTKIKPLK